MAVKIGIKNRDSWKFFVRNFNVEDLEAITLQPSDLIGTVDHILEIVEYSFSEQSQIDNESMYQFICTIQKLYRLEQYFTFIIGNDLDENNSKTTD